MSFLKNKFISCTLGIILVTSTLLSAGCTPQSQEKKLKIGISQFALHPSLDNCKDGFIEGLKQSGYIEGENIEVEYLISHGDISYANTIAKQLVDHKSDLICAIATPSALTAASAIEGTNIPLVFNAVSEPIRDGLIIEGQSAERNITGVSDRLPVEKQLQLIRDFLPDAKKIGILYSTSESNSVAQIEQYQAAAPAFGFEIIVKSITSANDINSALDALLPAVDCLQNTLDNTVVSSLPLLIQKATEAKKPIFGSEEEQVINGCLASEGFNYIDLGIRCGLMAARILNGERAGTIPFEIETKTRITINEDVLKQLNMSVPQPLLDRAGDSVPHPTLKNVIYFEAEDASALS